MIDSDEPKDGDFVRYVEQLVRTPHRGAPPMGGAPGEVVREAPARAGRDTLIKGLRDLLTNRAEAGGRDTARGSRPTAVTSLPTPRSAPLEPRAAPATKRSTVGPIPGDMAAISRLLTRVASIAIFAGVVALAMSFADDPPLPIDPVLGIGLLVGAAVLKRIARGIG